MRRATAGLALAALLLAAGCGGRKSQVMPEEAIDFSSYHHIGVAAFSDRNGKGQAVADAIDALLQQEMYEPVDEKALAQVLAKYKFDRELGYGLEALLSIRSQSGADVLLIGHMAPDWSAASVTMMETSNGAPVLRMVLRPRGRKKKTFATPEEVAQEFARVYAKLR
jgi:hypothetical protein